MPCLTWLLRYAGVNLMPSAATATGSSSRKERRVMTEKRLMLSSDSCRDKAGRGGRWWAEW